MNEERKTRLIKMAIGYGVSIIIGAALLLIVLNNYGYNAAETQKERIKILCDAFTVPGITLMLSAALVAVYNQGVFTGVMYGLRKLKDIFLPFIKSEYVKYGDYKRKKEEKKINHYSFLFFTGLLFMIPAIAFMVYFYQIP